MSGYVYGEVHGQSFRGGRATRTQQSDTAPKETPTALEYDKS